jgi:hypothetical protein
MVCLARLFRVPHALVGADLQYCEPLMGLRNPWVLDLQTMIAIPPVVWIWKLKPANKIFWLFLNFTLIQRFLSKTVSLFTFNSIIESRKDGCDRSLEIKVLVGLIKREINARFRWKSVDWLRKTGWVQKKQEWRFTANFQDGCQHLDNYSNAINQAFM